MEARRVELALVLAIALSAIPPLALYLWHRRLKSGRGIDSSGLGGAILALIAIGANLIPFMVLTLGGPDGRWERHFVAVHGLTFLALIASPILFLFMVITFVVEFRDRKKSAAWRATTAALGIWVLGVALGCTVGIDAGWWPSV